MTSGRYELTDEQWDKIKHYFEVAKKNGRPYKDVRNTVNGSVDTQKRCSVARFTCPLWSVECCLQIQQMARTRAFWKDFWRVNRRARGCRLHKTASQSQCRHLVECFFQKLKRYRRIATRYEKLAKRFLAFIHFACILIWLLLFIQQTQNEGNTFFSWKMFDNAS